MNDINNITFIIPTIGRKTLINTILSLKQQTIKEWKAIIIFDGINSNINENDERITIINCQKKGININNAGLVRNYGIQFCSTKWIAFVDDDDTISYNYLEKFYEELNLNNNLDVLIFRMNNNGKIIPSLTTENFYICDVGISFIIKKNIFDLIQFKPDSTEDFIILNQLRKKNYKIIISPFVLYFVKDSIHDNNITGNRVFINYKNNVHTLFNYFLLEYFLLE